LIQQDDRISFLGLAHLAPEKPVDIKITHSNGTTVTTQVKHTMTDEQIQWFQLGSALNLIKKNREG
jgi:aconitate hydratase